MAYRESPANLLATLRPVAVKARTQVVTPRPGVDPTIQPPPRVPVVTPRPTGRPTAPLQAPPFPPFTGPGLPVAGEGRAGISAPRAIQSFLRSIGLPPTLQGMTYAVRQSMAQGPQGRPLIEYLMNALQQQSQWHPSYNDTVPAATPPRATTMPVAGGEIGTTGLDAAGNVVNQTNYLATYGPAPNPPPAVTPAAPRLPGNPGWGPGPRPIFGAAGWS